MQYIVGFNGKPKVGKDTIANMLRYLLDQECNIPTHLDHLARPMRSMAMSLLGMNPNDFNLYTEVKDKPQKLLKHAVRGDMDSLRKLMIRTSEEFIKPNYGQDFWSRKLIEDHKWIMLGYPGILFVPDIGFPAEVGAFDALMEKVPQLHTLIVHVTRPGIEDIADSRVLCHGANYNLDLVNDGNPLEAARKVLDHIRLLGWNLDCEA